MLKNHQSALIYLVDDEPLLLEMLKFYLSRADESWNVKSFQNPVEALDAARAQSPDIVISDLTMPEMPGTALIEQIRQAAPNSLRILVSGYADSKAFSAAHQYLGKPFSFPDVRLKIQKALVSLQQFANPEIRKTVLSLRTLPVVPQVYYELLSALENPDSSYGEITDILKRDSGISAKMLQMANSPMYGKCVDSQAVVDIQQAVTMLGTECVKVTVLANKVFTFQKSIPDSFIPSKLAGHRSETAALAYELGQQMGLREEPARDAHVAGLLHDLGRVVLIDNFAKDYHEICDKALREKKTLTCVEEEIFKMSQADVVGFLVSLWGMRDRIARALVYQEKPWEAPPGEIQDTAAAVYLAHYKTHARQPSEMFEQPALNKEFLGRRGWLELVTT